MLVQDGGLSIKRILSYIPCQNRVCRAVSPIMNTYSLHRFLENTDRKTINMQTRTLPRKSSMWIPRPENVLIDDPLLEMVFQVTDACGKNVRVEATVGDIEVGECESQRVIYIDSITSESVDFDIRWFLHATAINYQGWGQVCIRSDAELQLGNPKSPLYVLELACPVALSGKYWKPHPGGVCVHPVRGKRLRHAE